MVFSICEEFRDLGLKHYEFDCRKGNRVRIRALSESPEAIGELMRIMTLAELYGHAAYWEGEVVEIAPKRISKRVRFAS